jgi:ATP-binding cassette subfamily F protein 3
VILNRAVFDFLRCLATLRPIMATLITISNLRKTYGPRVLFKNVNFSVTSEHKIGIVGRNGAGKSTLFSLITKREEYDRGMIAIHDGTRLGFLSQHDEFIVGETALTYLLRISGKEAWRAGKLGAQFGLTEARLNQPVADLSGGYQMRVKLVGLFLQEPNLILLDEPTNYLDVATQILLERFLKTFRGAHLIISHDREFLKHTCTETLDVENGDVVYYPGDVEEYFAYRAEVRMMQERYNKNVERERAHLQEFVDRFRYKASKAKQAQSKIKQIARLETIEIGTPASSARIVIPRAPEKKGLALRVEDLSVGYGERVIASRITFDIERGEHVAILGENGQGKTTLLKTLAGELTELGGKYKFSHNVSVGYFAQHTAATLDAHSTVGRYLEMKGYGLMREEILAMAGNFLFSLDDLDKTIGVLSGGERSRLALAGLLLEKHDVLLLDEPTNHLDLETVETLARALKEFNGTILFVSHNRTFVHEVAGMILEVGGGVVLRYPYTYEEYLYHVAQKNDGDTGVVKKPTSAVAAVEETGVSKTERYEQIKKLKRERTRIEEELKVLEDEKDRLLRYFEKYPTAYAPDKQKELAIATDLVEEKEKRWLEIESAIVECV